MVRHLSVLIIEDSENDADLIIRQLQKADYDASHERVETADQMRKALQRQPWDLVIADYTLPQFSATAALAILQESGLDIPFIVVSGTIGEEKAVEVMRSGANRCIMKDNLVRLIPAIERELSEAQTRQAKRAAEQALRESEERFRRYFDLGLIGMAITSPTKGCLEVNDEICRILGYERSELLQKTWAEMTHPDDLDADATNFSRVLAGEIDGYSIDKRFIRKDGKVVYATISVKCLRRADGSVDYFVTLLQDITEHKRAEEALRKSETKYRRLHESMTDAFAIVDMEGRLREWNHAYRSLTGYSDEELRHLTYADLTPARWHDMEAKIVKEEVLLLGYSHVYEKEYIRKGGAIIPIEIRTFLFRDDDGEPSGMWGMVRDITDRKQREKTLRESEAHFSTIFHLNPVAIAITRLRDGVLIEVNEAWQRVTGFTCEEVVGHTPAELNIWANPGDRVRRTSELSEKGVVQHELQVRHKSGSLFHMLMSAELIEQDGEQHVLSMGQDITEHKRAEEALRVSEERYSKVFRSSPDAVVVSRLSDGAIVEVNDSWERILGYNRAESIGSSSLFLNVFVDPEDRQKAVQGVVEQGRLRDFELDIRRKGGEVRRVSLSGERIEIGGEQCLITVIRDITERKLMEEALRESEARFSTIFHTSPVAIAITRPKDSALIDVNKAWEKVTGFTREEAVGRTPIELNTWANPGDRDRLTSELREKGVVQNFVFQVRHKSGSLSFMLMSAELIELDGEQYMLSLTQDITERKRAEDALVASEQRYRTVIEGANEGILVADIEGRQFKYANPAICRMLGYTAEELTRLGVADIHPKEALDGVRADFEAQARGEKIVATEIRCLRKDGSVLYADVATAQVVIDGTKCNVGFFTNITMRREMEQIRSKTLECQKRMTQLQEALLAPGQLVQKLKMITDGVVDIFGADFCRIWCIGPGDLCGLGCMHEALNEGPHACQDRDRCLRLMASSGRYTRTNGAVHRRVPFGAYKIGRVASGDEHKFLTNEAAHDPMIHNHDWARQLGIVSFAGYQLRPPGGETLGVLALFSTHAITPEDDALLDALSNTTAQVIRAAQAEEALRATEQQLRQSQKLEAIGTLASGIAHDFNNLLTIILGNADLMLGDLKDDHPFCRPLEETRKAANRAASLTRQLLAFSRKQIIEPKILDLNEIIHNTQKMLGRLIGENISLQTNLSPDLWPIEADPGQVEQVIMNLAVNARDAMPEGGDLTLMTQNKEVDGAFFKERGVNGGPGSYAVLRVADTGTGMSPEIRERIFEPFFTTKGVGKGTGLGLSTVYGIVKQNRGFIFVQSAPEAGTTFEILLPKAEAKKTDEARETSPQAKTLGSETILVVEDNEDVRAVAVESLNRYGYHALEATDGESALKLIRDDTRPIHLLLTDVIMPRMGGNQLAEQVSALRPGTKVLFMSGYTDESVSRYGVLKPGLALLHKPFSPEALAKKVREVLDTSPHPVL